MRGLRNKKAVAWLVMLTFLFTCIMPTNIMAGSSTAEAAAAVMANGVTVKVFNYNKNVNKEGLANQGYVFFNSQNNSVDGNDPKGSGTYNTPYMDPTLVNGYPDTSKGSMSYLFDDTYLEGTMTNGGGLFQKDANGYYYYDSAKNAAYYNKASNSFTLYDQVVYPSYIDKDNSNVERSNFLPFNAVNKNTATADGNVNGVPAMKLKSEVDLWFGMMVEFEFLMPKDGKMNGKDMVFDFYGDDDVFVYIDDVLLVDIGGTHAAQSGTINFATGAVDSPQGGESTIQKKFAEAGKNVTTGFDGATFADYTVHTLKFFYMERGGNISYCRLKFNMPVLPENSLTVEKELTADPTTPGELQEVLEETLHYQFRVLDEQGNVMLKGEEFTIKNTNDEIIGTDLVGSDGIFELKTGQRAVFSDMIEKTGQENYIVQEIIQDDLTGQYNNISYQVNGTGGTTQTDQEAAVGFTGYNTKTLEFDKAQFVRYTNQVDTEELSALQITKTIKDASTSTFDINREFEMQVKLGGELLPDGTKYSVTGEQGTRTSEGGIIKLQANQTATILGVLSGTTYEVQEINADDSNVVYIGDVAGEFTLNSVVSVTVENESKTINLSGTKYWVDNNNEVGKRPGKITVNLLADGDVVDSIDVDGDAKADRWTYKFENLPKYNADSEAIVYTVTEEPVENYTTQYDGFNIVNVIEQKYFDISGTKTWIAPEGTEYPEIVIDLFRDGEKFKEVTLTPGTTEYRFENLESYDLTDGRMYQYQLAERKVDGYIPSYEMRVDGKNRIIDITNTYSDEEEFVTISGEKKWVAPEGTVLPASVMINLYQNGKAIDEVEVTAEMNWQYSFENLAMYDEDGVAYSYTVKEEPVDGYLSLVVPTANGYDITNTLYVGEAGQFSVSKIVSGGDKMVPKDDTEYSFVLKVKATVNEWDSMKVYQKSELEDARDEALAELDTANKKLERAERVFRSNAVAFTTGSAYQFIMVEEVYDEEEPNVTTGSAYDYTTGSAYKYTIVDNDGDVLVKRSKSPLFTSLTPASDAAEAITRVIEAIKALADEFKNLNRGSVFLNRLYEGQQSSTPSALKFERNDAENLLQAERDVRDADALVAARERAIEEFVKKEVTTPSAIKITMTPTAGSGLEPMVLELDSSHALYDEDTMTYAIHFGLLKDTGYVFTIEATDKAVIEYSINEMDLGFDTYKGTEITVNGTEKLDGRYVTPRVLDKVSADTYLFNNIYADNPPPYVPPTEDEPDNPYVPPTEPEPQDPVDPPYVPPYVPPVIPVVPDEPVVPVVPDIPEEPVIIEEPDVPLVDIPGEIIEEEDIPLGDAPPTGDNANAVPFLMMMVLAAAGLLITRRRFN